MNTVYFAKTFASGVLTAKRSLVYANRDRPTRESAGGPFDNREYF
jgi:hypothetical protein